MSIIRRKFSKEQKLEIVRQSMEEGVNLVDLGKQYSLHVNTIYKWRQTFLSNEEICFPGNGNVVLTEMEKENLKLKKQLRETELERDILKKAIQERWKIYRFIDKYKQEFAIEKMCKVMEVSRSAYYKWKLNGDPQHIKRHARLIVDIKQAHGNSHKIYGSPRITQKLTDKGILVSKSTVARLMKSNSVKSKVKKKYRSTTDSKHDFKIADNLLDRNFNVALLNSVWISDITYIKIGNSWYYLTIIMDLADRMIIAWHLSSNLTAHDTVMRTWNKALEVRAIKQPLIFHSDRGVQYACDDFKDLLKASKMVTQSMSRKGNCWDNAVAESFFKTLKTEFVYHHVFANYEQAYRLIFQYIEAWYNTNRIHSSINNLSPLQMHLKLLINIAA